MPGCRTKENAPLTKVRGADILQIEKVLTGKRLVPYWLVRKMTAHSWETLRRSFFLAFIVAMRYSPCNLERHKNCSAEKRKQNRNFFKRHGVSPLSAFERPGERIIQENRLTRYTRIPVRNISRLRLGQHLPSFDGIFSVSQFKKKRNYPKTLPRNPVLDWKTEGAFLFLEAFNRGHAAYRTFC